MPSLLAYSDDGNPAYPAFQAANPRAAIMGGVYNYDPLLASPNRLPPRFDGSLFIMDWARHWVNEVRFASDGAVVSVAPFLSGQAPNGPIDMAFGPQGDMYLLEYDAHALYQVKYTGACKMTPVSAIGGSRKHAAGWERAHPYWIPPTGRIPLSGPSAELTFYDGRGRRLWRSPPAVARGAALWIEVPDRLRGALVWIR